MSRLFQVIAALAAIGTAVIVFTKTAPTTLTLKQKIEKAEGEIKELGAKLTKAAEDIAAAQKAKEDAEGKVAGLTSERDDAKTKASEAEGKLANLENQIAEEKKKAEDATAELAKLKEAVGTAASPEELKAREQELTTLREEKKMIEDKLASVQANLNKMQGEQDFQRRGITPPGVSGRVVAINTQWNFVVLDVGKSNGVVENGEMTVVRSGRPIAKIRVASVDQRTCVADVTKAASGFRPTVGDSVISN